MATVHLEFTTEDPSLRSICERYWAMDGNGVYRERAREIASELHISSKKLSELVRLSCRAWSEDIRCSSCRNPIFFGTRSDLPSQPQPETSRFVCHDCLAKQRARELEAQEAAARAFRERTRQTFTLSKRPIANVDQASLEELVALVALFRIAASEDLRQFRPMEDWQTRLAPTQA